MKGNDMTYEELKANYTVAYQIIMRERARRNNPRVSTVGYREEYIGEMDKLLEVIDDLKNALKEYISAEPEQATLLDVVRKAEYR